jgi:hypothetical protein
MESPRLGQLCISGAMLYRQMPELTDALELTGSASDFND